MIKRERERDIYVCVCVCVRGAYVRVGVLIEAERVNERYQQLNLEYYVFMFYLQDELTTVFKRFSNN